MSKIAKVLTTGKTRTTPAQAGNAHGNLNINLSAPGNAAARSHAFENIGPHPTAEQLFAGAWSACYTAALGLAAAEMKVALPAGTAVEIEVDLGQTGPEYYIQGRLTLIVPGLAQDLAAELAHAADRICPYSKATRGNIDVVLSVVTA